MPPTTRSRSSSNIISRTQPSKPGPRPRKRTKTPVSSRSVISNRRTSQISNPPHPHPQDTDALLRKLHKALDERSEETFKQWMERYMRHETPSRGVRMKGVRDALHSWRETHVMQTGLSLREEFDMAVSMFRGDYTEDKLAGTLYLQEVLLPAGAISVRDMEVFAQLFDEGWIHDWNVCDWFCVRVLAGVVEREGDAAMEVLCGWRDAENVWRARASVVGLLGLSGQPEFYERIRGCCQVLIRREERFAKTCVGWMLREIAKSDRGFVEGFLEAELSSFSVESMKNATKGFGERDGKVWLLKLKECTKKQ